MDSALLQLMRIIAKAAMRPRPVGGEGDRPENRETGKTNDQERCDLRPQGRYLRPL